MNRFLGMAMFLVSIPQLNGCGLISGSGEVSGVVLVDGTPAPGFQISFTSTENPELVIHGMVGEAGQFRLRRGRGKTDIPTGEYRVTLVPASVGETIPKSKLILPERVAHVDQTDLRKEVVRGKNELTIQVDTKP